VTVVLFGETLLVVTGFVVVALALGDPLLRAVERATLWSSNSRRELLDPPQVGAVLLAGLGAEAVIGMVLALLGVFSAWSLALCAVAACFFGRSTLDRYVQRSLNVRRPRLAVIDLAGLALAVVLFASVFLASMTPPHGWDELAYHLPQAEIIAMGHLPTTVGGHYFYGNLPQLVEILNAEGIAVSTYLVPHVLNATLLGAFLLFVGGVLRRLYGLRTGIVAVLMILLYEELTRNVATGYIDAATVSLELAAVLSAALALSLRSLEPVGQAALFIGLALASKYSALASFVFLVGLGVAGAFLVRPAIGRALRLVLVTATVVVAVAGYWYLKNWIKFGNPTYPLLFGHRDIDSATYQGLVDAIQQFGPRNVWAFLALPARFADTANAVVLVALVAFPLALLVPKQRTFVRVMSAYCLWYMGYWFFIGSHQLRFFMPAAIAAMLLLAIALVQTPAPAVPAVALLAFTLWFVAYPQIGHGFVRDFPHVAASKLQASRLKYSLGLESETEFLTRQFGCTYRIVRALETRPGRGKVIDNWSQWHDPPVTYYARKHPFKPFTSDSRSASRIQAQLRAQGFAYLYIRPETKRRFAANVDPLVTAYRSGRDEVEAIILRRSRPLLETQGCLLFRLPT
jgi:hypothetical protein